MARQSDASAKLQMQTQQQLQRPPRFLLNATVSGLLAVLGVVFFSQLVSLSHTGARLRTIVEQTAIAGLVSVGGPPSAEPPGADEIGTAAVAIDPADVIYVPITSWRSPTCSPLPPGVSHSNSKTPSITRSSSKTPSRTMAPSLTPSLTPPPSKTASNSGSATRTPSQTQTNWGSDEKEALRRLNARLSDPLAGCTDKWRSTVAEYAAFHADGVRKLRAKQQNAPRAVVYECLETPDDSLLVSQDCGGFADRLVGLNHVFLFALLHNLLFFIHWPNHAHVFHSPFIDMVYDDELMMGWGNRTTEDHSFVGCPDRVGNCPLGLSEDESRQVRGMPRPCWELPVGALGG